MSAVVGSAAPDFELDGVDGATGEVSRYRLSDRRGAPVLLVFYPADNSAVCRRQLEAYTVGIDALAEIGVGLLALSPQSIESHRRFAADRGGFAFPLLSDVGKSVARDYGNLGLLDLYRRCTVLVDRDGMVRYVHRSLGPGLGFKPVHELVEAARRSL